MEEHSVAMFITVKAACARVYEGDEPWEDIVMKSGKS
jgi:hypothetical protein